MATHSSIFAWIIPMDSGRLCPWGHKESDTTEQLSTAHHTVHMKQGALLWSLLCLPFCCCYYCIFSFLLVGVELIGFGRKCQFKSESLFQFFLDSL